MQGYISPSDGNFVAKTPDGECRYRLWDHGAMGGCLAGSWILVMGGSNANVLALQLLSMLGLKLDASFVLAHRYSKVLDFVIENGAVRHVRNTYWPAFETSDRHTWDPHLRNLTALLSSAPSVNATGVLTLRFTFFMARFWDQVATVLDAVESVEGPWRRAPLFIVTQVALHYVYCAKWKVPWCPDGEIKAMANAEALRVFEMDMRMSVRRLSLLCASGARGGRHGCAILNMQYGGAGHRDHLPYDRKTKEIALGCGCTQLRFVDLSTFTRSTSHLLDGHQDPAGAIITWNILLSGACATALPAQGSELVFSGETCFRAFYRHSLCQDCPNCKPWECLLAGDCKVDVLCLSGNCLVRAETQSPAEEVGTSGAHALWMVDGFEPRGRGLNRACRGRDQEDNSGSYYSLTTGVHTLEQCKALCVAHASCKAVEFSAELSRCEVWTREGGVQATKEAGCYTCLRYNRTAAMPSAAIAAFAPIGTAFAAILIFCLCCYFLVRRAGVFGARRYSPVS